MKISERIGALLGICLVASLAMAPAGCSKDDKVNEKAKFAANLSPVKIAAPASAPATGPASKPSAPASKPADTKPAPAGSGQAEFEVNNEGTAVQYKIKAAGVSDTTVARITIAGAQDTVVEIPVAQAGAVKDKTWEGSIAPTMIRRPPNISIPELEYLLTAFRDKKATLTICTSRWPEGELTGPVLRVTVNLAEVSQAEQQAAEQSVQAEYSRAGNRVEVPKYATPREREYYQDLSVLSQYPHRLAGYEDGSRAASRFVENRLKAMGIPKVAVQEFPIVMPRTTECRLLVDGKEAISTDGKSVLYAVRGNMLQESITPAEGLTGTAAYVGRGAIKEYAGNLVQDKIAVIDFNCDRNWLTAFACGARAVLFVGTPDGLAREAEHHWVLPANLPRFYVTRETADRLGLRDNTRTKKLTIFAACKWMRLRGRNVVAFIPGTAPRPADNADGLPQTLVLAAPLDTLSEVPQLGPGAREAANLAGLLQIADTLHRNPPQRDTLVCFFDGQSQHHAGASAFYGAINRAKPGLPDKPAQFEEIIDNYTKEQAFVQQVLKVLSHKRTDKGGTPHCDPFLPEAKACVQKKVYQQVMQIVRGEGLNISGDILEELRSINLRRRDIQRQIDDLKKQAEKADAAGKANCEREVAALKERLAPLDAKRAEVSVHDTAWNNVQQDLHNEEIGPLDKLPAEAFKKDPSQWTAEEKKQWQPLVDLLGAFDTLFALSQRIYSERQVELEQLLADARVGIKLRDEFGPDKRQIVLHVSMNLGDARDRWIFAHGDSSEAWISYDTPGIYKTIWGAAADVNRCATIVPVAGTGKNVQWIRDAMAPTRMEPAELLDDIRQEGIGNFDPTSIHQDLATDRFTPCHHVDSGTVARMFGTLNVSLMTMLDPLPRQALPGDTVEALKPQNVLSQATGAATFLHRLSGHPQLNASSGLQLTALYFDSEWSDTSNRLDGPSIKRAGGGAMRSRPVRGATVALMPKPYIGTWQYYMGKYPPGYERAVLTQSNMYGIYEPALISNVYFNKGKSAYVLAATFDEKQTPQGTTISRGLIDTMSSEDSYKPDGLATKPVTLFKTKYKTIVGAGFDRGVVKSLIMPAQSSSPFRLDRSFLCEAENVLTMFAPADTKGFKIFNKNGWMLLGNTPDQYEGSGFDLDDPFEHPVTCAVTSHDAQALNDGRFSLLRRNRINEESLQEIAEIAREIDTKARELANGFVPTPPAGADAVDIPKDSALHVYGDLEAASALNRRVYIPLVDVMNDLVTAVVLLLLLAIPFAFALERLLIGTPHIYRQIGWFGIFFLATFAVLFFVNPAFRIAATPIIIFLAFAIILLSSLVIFIMVRKLQTEMKKLQGMATTVHSTDVSRLSTMMAAVSMGISTMRRRPLRTLLTSATVVLLTFTILTFASFGSTWGAKRMHIGAMSGSVPRIVVRHQFWSPIRPGLMDTLQGHFAQRAKVVPRYWVSPTASEAAGCADQPNALDMIVSDPEVAKLSAVSAAIGIDPADLRLLRPPAVAGKQPPSDLEEQLVGDLEMLKGDGVFFTLTIAKSLNLGLEVNRPDPGPDPRKPSRRALEWDRVVTELNLPVTEGRVQVDKLATPFRQVTLNQSPAVLFIGRKLLLDGKSFTFAGVMREQMSSYNILEGSSILPVDYTASAGSSGVSTFSEQEAGLTISQLPDQPNAQFVPFAIDKVAVIGAEAAKRMKAHLRSVNIFPENPLEIQEIANRTANVTALPTYVGDANGVYRLFFTSLTQASGIKDLLIPVLLGGLIVFATMLGSVSDREREIYTFSSLGLAPPHVASLFFAEASMYAVIGGMGGYLLGQVVARLLNWLSTIMDFTVPSMNYSSTNAIVTVLIVMSTVLISTIYPAVKASRSANPGIQRSWKAPKPKDNLYDLVFPFTVSAYDIIGVVSFLKEHFDNFTDTSLGVFATTRSGVFRQKDNDMLGFEAKVALAPFDLGVNQAFALLSKPSDIEGINEVRILIHRTTGAQGDWERANRVFINDLRKQLLIWRSLPHEAMDKYRQVTLEQWDHLPVQLVDGRNIGGSL